MKKRVMYAGIALLFMGFFMGHVIASIIFFGIITAGSVIALILTAGKSFKLWCGRWGFIIDFIGFLLSTVAIATVGVTVAGGLAVASLIFTLFRVGYLVPYYESNRPVKEPRSIGSYIRGSVIWMFNGITNFFNSLFTSGSKDKLVNN